MTDANKLWDAVLTRNTSGTGDFIYGVKTTRIYCRPTCPSRRPLRKNVLFFATPAEARAQGYRACKRCRPDEAPGTRSTSPMNAVVHELARQIEAHPDQPFRLAQLAQRAGYSPFHLQRNFKAIIGSTPKEYQTAARLRTLKQELRKDAPVSDAIYQAGFG